MNALETYKRIKNDPDIQAAMSDVLRPVTSWPEEQMRTAGGYIDQISRGLQQTYNPQQPQALTGLFLWVNP